MLALVAAVLLSQNTPRHPSPATADGLPVGNGTNWVTSVVPTCNSPVSALQYTGGGVGFTCGAITNDGGTAATTVTASTPVTSTPITGGYDISLGTVPVTKGGTAITTVMYGQTLIGASSSAYANVTVPDCHGSNMGLGYDSATNLLYCNGTSLGSLDAGVVNSITGVSPLSAVYDGGGGYTLFLSTVPVTSGGSGLTSVATNQVYVATGANAFTAKTLPNCTSSLSHLAYDNATQTFSCVTNTVASVSNVWSTFCPSGTTCTDNSLTFLSWYTPKVTTTVAKKIECNATATGSASGNVAIVVYDGTSNVGTCNIPCSTGTTRTSAVCDTGGFTMNGGTTYRLYMGALTGGCLSVPANIWCNLPLESP